jgi:hypothetical protein
MNSTTPATYVDVFDRFERDKIRYVVVSGIAVVLHGYVRPVFDLDMVIDPAPQKAARAMNALALTGFVPSLPLPLNLLTVMRMFDSTQREVDIFVRYHIPFDEMWLKSELVKVGDHSIARAMSLEHLLRAKRITGRPHDILDIEGLRTLEVRGLGGETDAVEREGPA